MDKLGGEVNRLKERYVSGSITLRELEWRVDVLDTIPKDASCERHDWWLDGGRSPCQICTDGGLWDHATIPDEFKDESIDYPNGDAVAAITFEENHD